MANSSSSSSSSSHSCSRHRRRLLEMTAGWDFPLILLPFQLSSGPCSPTFLPSFSCPPPCFPLPFLPPPFLSLPFYLVPTLPQQVRRSPAAKRFRCIIRLKSAHLFHFHNVMSHSLFLLYILAVYNSNITKFLCGNLGAWALRPQLLAVGAIAPWSRRLWQL